KLGDVAQDDDVRALADVDLGAGNQGEVAGPEHAALGGIRALEMLVNRPEVRRVEMFRERETVESHPAGHTYHALHRSRVELEMLRHLRVRVGIDPLQTVRLLSEIRPQSSTTIHSAKRPPTRSEPAVLVSTALLYTIYCCPGITERQIVCCWGQTGVCPVDNVDKKKGPGVPTRLGGAEAPGDSLTAEVAGCAVEDEQTVGERDEPISVVGGEGRRGGAGQHGEPLAMGERAEQGAHGRQVG